MKNKNIFIILSIIFSFSAFAAEDCTFHVGSEIINYEGYPLNPGPELRKIMETKGYKEVFPSLNIVEAKFRTYQGQFFQQAQTSIQMTVADTQELVAQSQGQVRCLTQLCSIWDAQKSIMNALKEFVEQIPSCN